MKKKRRYERHRKTSHAPSQAFDRHHIWFQRKHYSGFWANKLRNHPYSIILIPKNTIHRAIHRAVEDITVPSEDKCKDLYLKLCERWNAGELKETDSLEKRLDVFIDMFASESETVKCLEATKDAAKKGG